MRFAPHILDEIRSRLPVSHVVSRKVALKKKGREFAGLSPFKTEKTPSFFVNDQKGFYHCFATGEHGDIFTFVMKTEGLSFPEAVERLASDAGVQLPKASPGQEAQQDERQRLYDLLQNAARYFQNQLRTGEGRLAAEYLTRRGLSRETLVNFGLGYAPNNRTALKSHLANAGFTIRDMALSGMLIHGEDIAEPYDRFRHRIMFPITDTKGRVIAFGGRALDPDQPAKYLNSPETPLFHKGHVLYNAHTARPSAFEKSRIIAVEGYMDVIALNQAGFAEAVAPLGTALTASQLQALWRMTPEPFLCFDGDGAGRKAAYRAIDTALPILQPGHSLSFVFLPDGCDPDDLVRTGGAEPFETLLKDARPMSQVLFDREWRSGDWSTPERRAKLELQIRKLTASITDGSVRAHYERDMRDRLFKAWAPTQKSRDKSATSRQPSHADRHRSAGDTFTGQATGPGRPRRRDAAGPPAPSAALIDSLLAKGPVVTAPYREALILQTLLNHPWLIDDEAETIASLPLTSAPLNELRGAILSAHASQNSLDRKALRFHLQQLGVESLLELVDRSITHRSDRFCEPDTNEVEVRDGWRHITEHHMHQMGSHQSLEAAQRAWHEEGTEAAQSELLELRRNLLEPGDKHVLNPEPRD